MLVAYTGSPILPHTFNLENGFPPGTIIFTDGLGSKFMSNAGVKSQGANREVVKVPLVSAVLETQGYPSEILFVVEAAESGTFSFLPSNVNLVQPCHRC